MKWTGNAEGVRFLQGATSNLANATTGTLTQGDASIAVSNGSATANQQLHKIVDSWTKDQTIDNVTIVAILVGKSATENQLLPISMTSEATGISEVESGKWKVESGK